MRSAADTSPKMSLPPGAEEYLVLQRPGLRWRHHARFPTFYERHAAQIERLRRRKVGMQYGREIAWEMAVIRPHLPELAHARVLDIGCGCAGIDIRIYEHYRHAELTLLDKDGTSEVYFGFRDDAAYYNSLAVAREVLEFNGVPAEAISTVDVLRDPFPSGPFDVVISLLSWGHHYPVSTYSERVARMLAPNGVVILHSRHDTDGEETLRATFRRVEAIEERQKSTRFLAAQPLR